MEHDRACWGVLRRTKGDAAFPEVIPLCATRVVIGRRPEHYEAPDTVFRTASAHDDALPDVASTQIDRVALGASKRLSKVHCLFQRTDHNAAVVECHSNNGFAVNPAPVGRGTRASLRAGDGGQVLGDGPGPPGGGEAGSAASDGAGSAAGSGTRAAGNRTVPVVERYTVPEEYRELLAAAWPQFPWSKLVEFVVSAPEGSGTSIRALSPKGTTEAP